MLSINLLAVVVAAIAAFVLAFLAHGPVAGKLWMKLADVHPKGNEKFKDMIPNMLWNFLVQFVTALVLALLLLFTSSSPLLPGITTVNGIILGILVWFGFLVTSSAVDVIWMGKNYKLWLFEAVSSLIVMVAMGAIIGCW
ncbi:MAG: DUF1761 domain-containing protein [bacterium]